MFTRAIAPERVSIHDLLRAGTSDRYYTCYTASLAGAHSLVALFYDSSSGEYRAYCFLIEATTTTERSVSASIKPFSRFRIRHSDSSGHGRQSGALCARKLQRAKAAVLFLYGAYVGLRLKGSGTLRRCCFLSEGERIRKIFWNVMIVREEESRFFGKRVCSFVKMHTYEGRKVFVDSCGKLSFL